MSAGVHGLWSVEGQADGFAVSWVLSHILGDCWP